MLRFLSALVAIFALYSIRAYFVLGGAFFGVVLLRGAYGSLRAGEHLEANFIAVLGFWLLVISYRWFAVRWHEVQNDPPAP